MWTTDINTYMIILSRMAGVCLFLPGIGETFIPSRIRMLIAIILSAVMTPVLFPDGSDPMVQKTKLSFGSNATMMVMMGEFLVGCFLGSLVRMAITVFDMVGHAISMMAGLGSVSMFNPTVRQESPLSATLLSMGALMVIFSLSLHHDWIRAIFNSYAIIPLGDLPIEDMYKTIETIISKIFLLTITLSAPFIVLIIVLYVGLGILNRLMPQMQIFFVTMPLQILVGLFLMVGTIGIILEHGIDRAMDMINSTLDRD